MIIIVDYGMGNLASIQNMLKYLGFESISTSDKSVIEGAKKIILPGVGSFDKAIENIQKLGLWNILNFKALEQKIPFLGICLGMQLLTSNSEEGVKKGFGWIDAETIKFRTSKNNLKIPHMGWNYINIIENSNPLLLNMYDKPRFYFVHSYFVKCKNKENVLCQTNYGEEFDSVIYRNNIYGCQFHPEKSHKYGFKLLTNFAKII